MSGYTFSIGPRHYDAWKDGKPFSLVEILYEIDGVGGVTVYRPNGSTLLDNAGSELARRDYVRRQKRERWDRLYARRWRVAS